MIVVATAGWSIPRTSAARFGAEGTQLQRYAAVLRGVEINSSFYREHSRQTYAGWARQTPRGFRFAVKLPRRITHDQRLGSARRPLAQFLEQIEGLGGRLGPLVVQLPPSLEFDLRVARKFFRLLRELHQGPVACEPRHASWFEPGPEALLLHMHISRIAADPAPTPAAGHPGGWPGLVYYRLHGSPRKYWSIYERPRVDAWTRELQALRRGTLAWCVFDNTASGGAAGNALQMREMVHGPG